MRVGSLFSGIGGIDLGLERAGMHVAWQCEADSFRRSVLAARFPGVECGTDVRSVGLEPSRDDGHAGGRNGRAAAVKSELSRLRQCDLVCGGFPCQDLSVAGRRAGLSGERSGLFFEFARIADTVLAPGGWLLLENVPGLLSSNGGRDYAVVLATLAELGFHDLAWRILDSRHFGVAQRRRRVYILARRARGSRACQVLLEPEGSAGHPQTRREAGPDVAGTLGGGSGSRGWPQDTERMTFIPTEDDTNLVPAVFNWQPGGDFRLGYSEQGPTALQKEQTPAAITSQGVRRLTPRECERLQGFPDDWTLIPGASDSKRYAALGDAVTVPVAEWIGHRLMEVAA